MPSRYEERLKELALEADEDRRLELAASIDADAEGLNESYDYREELGKAVSERDAVKADLDAAVVERDEWKRRYANRFFDSGEGAKSKEEVLAAHEADIKRESRPRGYAALWDDRIN